MPLVWTSPLTYSPTHLVVPPVLPSGLPGPRSLRGNVAYWLMPHDLATILKWRLLPAGRATAAHKKAHTRTSILSAADVLFNKELPALRPEWGDIRTSCAGPASESDHFSTKMLTLFAAAAGVATHIHV